MSNLLKLLVPLLIVLFGAEFSMANNAFFSGVEARVNFEPNTAPLVATQTDSVVTNFLGALSANTPQRVNTRRSLSRRRGRGAVSVVELPTQRVGNQTQFACGSRAIRTSRSLPYMHPVSACMLSGVAQQWRQEVCPNNTPDCQLLIGDTSFGHSMPGHWPHASHRRGFCADIWPIRKPGASGELDRFDANYDRERTRRLVEIMHQWGSDTPNGGSGNNQIFFNDPSMYRTSRLTRYFRAHNDHIHVCFRPNARNRRRCQEAEFSTRLCPGLTSAEQRVANVSALEFRSQEEAVATPVVGERNAFSVDY